MCLLLGPNSRYTTRGGHAEDFTPRLGKIHYFGTAMPAGDVWKAKDYLYQHIGQRAQQVYLQRLHSEVANTGLDRDAI
jgi:hypothetical protein